ncbi:gag-Pol polyprotein [Trichonephila clavipes]|nr:gag-Pol polyprotein [Trichonephila clavipes]
MITTHLDPLELYLDSQVTKLKEETPYSVTDVGLLVSSRQNVLPARELIKWKQQKQFFKKTFEDITLSAFELGEDEGKNLSPEQARKLSILLNRNEACFQPREETTPFIEHHIDMSDHTLIATFPYRMNPVKKQDCQKESLDRRRRKYYKPGDEAWVTIYLISFNNRSRKFMPKREDAYLILTLRSPVTYEIAAPSNLNQVLRTYHISALNDYQEPKLERNTEFGAPLRKRGRSKKKLPSGSEPRRQRNQRGSQ